MLAKVNTDLYGKSIGIENKNGFELYRLIVKAADDIPENAKFVLGAELTELVSKYKAKITSLKALYGFRLLLKKRAGEYKKHCLLYTSPSPRDGLLSRMPSSA